MSASLGSILKEKIRKKGAISFATFMQNALYHPLYGYYTSKKQIFGKEGDFVTSPVVSHLFSCCLAEQFIQSNMQNICEIGAGDGRLCKDILLYLQNKKKIPAEYTIVEISANLKKQQQKLIKDNMPDYYNKVKWQNEIPDGYSGFIIANEVLDALPVEIFRTYEDGLLQLYIDVKENKFYKVFKDAQEDIKKEFYTIQKQLVDKIPNSYESEICLSLKPFLQNIDKKIKSAVLLFIDYGYPIYEYYRQERTGGTILSYYKHRAYYDVLKYVGRSDISCFVDFSRVAQTAMDLNWGLEGFINQGSFLINNDIFQIIQQQTKPSYKQEITNLQSLKKLIMPADMGQRFCVLGLSKNYNGTLQGFDKNDETYRL
jgi:SAM-dependent MidA family methyltransferase